MDKKISELTAAGALTGTEDVEVIQGGANVKTTAQDIADIGDFWPLVGVADLTGYTQITSTETGDPTHTAYIFGDEGTIGFSGDFNGETFSLSTGNNEAVFTDDRNDKVGLVYADDYSADFVPRSLVDKAYVDAQVVGGGGHIIEDEGTPLTQRSTLNFVGSGVGVTDAGGKTVVTIVAGTIDYARQPLTVAGSTTAMDFVSLTYRNFDITATQSANFSITFANAGSMVESRLTMRITGTVVITLPSSVVMQQYETINGRWDTSGNNLTLIGTTATPFMLTFYSDGTNVICSASDPTE